MNSGTSCSARAKYQQSHQLPPTKAALPCTEACTCQDNWNNCLSKEDSEDDNDSDDDTDDDTNDQMTLNLGFVDANSIAILLTYFNL